MRLCLVLLVWLLMLSRAVTASGAVAEDPREVDARARFALTDYQGAVEIFARLYAEKGDPVYLRNIGRCFQMLGETQKAISSFEEYLRKSRRISDAERVEVRGFIDDLRRRAASGAGPAMKKAPPAAAPAAPPSKAPESARPAAPPPSPSPPPPPSKPVSPPPKLALAEPPRAAAPPTTTAAPAKLVPPVLVADTADAPAPASPPFYRRWWFWTGVAVAAAAITVTAAATGAFTHTENATCPAGRQCNP